MKKIFFILLAAITVSLASCNKDFLETAPTTAVSGDTMLNTEDGGLMALNGVFRFFWQWGATTTSNYHQSFGPQSYALMGDLMGEDMVQAASGNGWFWYDYCYNVKTRYTSGGWRSYDCWNYYYTIISNVNYILDKENEFKEAGTEISNTWKYILGNAYALRAYAYHYLEMTFARSYIGHEDRLGVPIYTEPTVAGTEGQPRSTNKAVYAQAVKDIDAAIAYLNGQSKQHVSHIDYYVANGIKARIALYMGDYTAAYAAAKIAMSASGKNVAFDASQHFNDSGASNVLWGAEIITDQGTTNPQFLAHMDIAFGGYGKASRKCCSAELISKINAADKRIKWWNYEVLEDGKTLGYQQYKFLFKDASVPTSGADHIFMRMPEMYLIAAECACRGAGSGESEAKSLLNEMMSTRQDGYDCSAKTGTSLGALTTDYTGSLLEEIILQRRIELWGEYGRIYDIKRLRQGFKRTAAMGHPTAGLLTTLHTDDPESFDWVLTIPSAETDANPLMVQNPTGSYEADGQGDDPALTPSIDK